MITPSINRFLLIIAFTFSINAYAGPIIKNAYIQAVPQGYEDAPAFITIKNNDRYPLYLKGVSSPISERSLLQQYQNNDGAMMLQTVTDIKIPANSTLKMQPGDLQITLKDLYKTPKEKSKIKLILNFSNGKSITTNASVKKLNN